MAHVSLDSIVRRDVITLSPVAAVFYNDVGCSIGVPEDGDIRNLQTVVVSLTYVLYAHSPLNLSNATTLHFTSNGPDLIIRDIQ